MNDRRRALSCACAATRTISKRVHYASQSLVVLNVPQASRSDDGGLTFGPSVLTTSACGGLHGHIKVAPDGTVFIPNNSCSGEGAVLVSGDNGITWNIRTVPSTTSNPALQDPQVGIDNNGRVYFVMSSATGTGSQAVVATSDNHGVTWNNVFDVGAAYKLRNVFYPAAVAANAAVRPLRSTARRQVEMDQPIVSAVSGISTLPIHSTEDKRGQPPMSLQTIRCNAVAFGRTARPISAATCSTFST
jgi:hypothetical protein